MMEEVLYESFLNLSKAYGALDRDRCMDIVVGYKVGPQTERILRYYWYHISKVARAGGYCGIPARIQGELDVLKGLFGMF